MILDSASMATCDRKQLQHGEAWPNLEGFLSNKKKLADSKMKGDSAASSKLLDAILKAKNSKILKALVSDITSNHDIEKVKLNNTVITSNHDLKKVKSNNAVILFKPQS